MKTPRLILFYNTMYGVPLDYSIDELPEDFCITTDRSCFQQADYVVFHILDLWNIIGSDELEIRKGQIWIAWSLECEVNYPEVENLEFCELFDLWMGYHANDDIIHSYCRYDYKEILVYLLATIFQKNKACMFISKRFNQRNRKDHLYELMKYADVDLYSRLFNTESLFDDIGNKTLLDVVRKHKFVISFNNAIAQDYVTEKSSITLFLLVLFPFILGAPNIYDFVPDENYFACVSFF